MSRVLGTFFLALVVSFGANAFEGDAKAGKEKSQTCVACHSADGNSAIPTNPVLAGQHAGYLFKQLSNYKDAKSGRANAIMAGMVAALTEQDMKDLSAYFASQKPKAAYAKEESLELGEMIYRGGIVEKGVPACAACHSPTGNGNAAAKYPRVAGQHADYTLDQLKQFRSGTRYNDLNAMMRNIAAKLSDKEMEAVANYMVGLH